MIRSALAWCAVALMSSVASAAIIYEPVQTQYQDPRYGGPIVYYGGDNPLVFHSMRNLQARYNAETNPNGVGVSFAREGRLGYDLVHPGLTTQIPYVFTDLLPIGMNGYAYGFSENDAHNEAMSRVPLYFRMSDLRGYREPDGTVVVPPTQPRGYIDIHPVRPASTQPAAAVSTDRIIIIPKSLLNKKLNAKGNSVAQAQ